jgi:hypothetical protein
MCIIQYNDNTEHVNEMNHITATTILLPTVFGLEFALWYLDTYTDPLPNASTVALSGTSRASTNIHVRTVHAEVI